MACVATLRDLSPVEGTERQLAGVGRHPLRYAVQYSVFEHVVLVRVHLFLPTVLEHPEDGEMREVRDDEPPGLSHRAPGHAPRDSEPSPIYQTAPRHGGGGGPIPRRHSQNSAALNGPMGAWFVYRCTTGHVRGQTAVTGAIRPSLEGGGASIYSQQASTVGRPINHPSPSTYRLPLTFWW